MGQQVDPLLANPTVPATRAVIDACRPWDRIDTFPRVAQSSPAQVRETVAMGASSSPIRVSRYRIPWFLPAP